MPLLLCPLPPHISPLMTSVVFMHLRQSSENALCLHVIDRQDGFFEPIGGRNALIGQKWAGGGLKSKWSLTEAVIQNRYSHRVFHSHNWRRAVALLTNDPQVIALAGESGSDSNALSTFYIYYKLVTCALQVIALYIENNCLPRSRGSAINLFCHRTHWAGHCITFQWLIRLAKAQVKSSQLYLSLKRQLVVQQE